MKNLMIMSKVISRKQAFNIAICILLLPVFVFLSNADSFSQTNDYVYQIPKKLNDGWEVSSLGNEGIDKEPIEEISRLIMNINSVHNA